MVFALNSANRSANVPAVAKHRHNRKLWDSLLQGTVTVGIVVVVDFHRTTSAELNVHAFTGSVSK